MGETTKPRTLDEMVEVQRQYTAKVAACDHDWKPPRFDPDLGRACAKCDVRELPWLRARLSAAERERDAFRERLLGRANEEPPSGWLRPGEDGYEDTPEGARQARDAAIRDRDAAFARGVEAAAACLTGLEDLVGEFSAVEIRCRIRALSPAPDAGKETT